ncbi:hypothetical protein [Ruminiclostridium cellulolyticum]|uniref:Phage transcriptional regulator, RinA family n=1 Tax=Ruminiclostridium cellulolyticum (strain ATCC 35319 / DSM 5812 / JCM 6584 / H10) TaxID=394503 RepID=B8I913_RUMCH|nr:hypothetical protein [Ruminiclostridium cellulolyticum]ACL77345.1 conserved hypothetical protein [Ruminiclostridium cellulolyticum H10]
MKKDHIRDYATEAFRFYAKSGGKESYIKYLMDDIIKSKGNGVCNPTESTLISKEKIMETRAAEFADIEAVDRVLAILVKSYQGNYIRKAIEMVYFKDCWKNTEKGEISKRIHYAEIHIPASERQIYRWLKRARILFAEERGLRF